MIKNIQNHFIICGYGRMGKTLCQQLTSQGIDVVAIESDPDQVSLEKEQQSKIHFIFGDATDDATLKKAHIDTARGIATVIGSDADNLFVVLSARILSEDITIISRAANANTIDKLYKAGANRVVSPYTAGANKMAQLLTHPQLSEIFDWEGEGRDVMEMAEITVDGRSNYKGKTLAETDFKKKGVMVVAVRKPDGQIVFPPRADEQINEGDYLVALGKKECIGRVLAEE